MRSAANEWFLKEACMVFITDCRRLAQHILIDFVVQRHKNKASIQTYLLSATSPCSVALDLWLFLQDFCNLHLKGNLMIEV